MERFLAEDLQYEPESFDAVLMWDVCDYLPEPLVKPVVERIYQITKPRGALLAFFHTRDAGAEAPYYRYHIKNEETLELQQGPHFQLQRVFQNRHVENLFHEYTRSSSSWARRTFAKCCWCAKRSPVPLPTIVCRAGWCSSR